MINDLFYKNYHVNTIIDVLFIIVMALIFIDHPNWALFFILSGIYIRQGN